MVSIISSGLILFILLSIFDVVEDVHAKLDLFQTGLLKFLIEVLMLIVGFWLLTSTFNYVLLNS